MNKENTTKYKLRKRFIARTDAAIAPPLPVGLDRQQVPEQRLTASKTLAPQHPALRAVWRHKRAVADRLSALEAELQALQARELSAFHRWRARGNDADFDVVQEMQEAQEELTPLRNAFRRTLERVELQYHAKLTRLRIAED